MAKSITKDFLIPAIKWSAPRVKDVTVISVKWAAPRIKAGASKIKRKIEEGKKGKLRRTTKGKFVKILE